MDTLLGHDPEMIDETAERMRMADRGRDSGVYGVDVTAHVSGSSWPNAIRLRNAVWKWRSAIALYLRRTSMSPAGKRAFRKFLTSRPVRVTCP